nr:sodium-coupled monocarboxylate transporter 2-like [Parasteatoda tepidariorum]
MGLSPCLYGPSLALSAVTDLSLNMCILVIGGVCTFYCAMGGLKAVLWTDVLQAVLMFIFVIAFYSAGVSDAGGISNIYDRAMSGGRLQIFNFSLDFTVRYTFWNCLCRGFLYGFGGYGASQLEVQRLLSTNDVKKAQRCLLFSIIPVFVFHSLSNLAGLVLYSLYYLCDPVLDKAQTGLTKYDQMMPYYIIRKFIAYPGLTGLCIAGIFSGSLSTISSILNCLSTVTMVDYVQPCFATISEKKNVLLAKTFSVLYGLIGIGLAFAFSYVQSLKQFGITLFALEGSAIVIFLIGILTRKADDKYHTVHLQWIPSHVDIFGNEQADRGRKTYAVCSKCETQQASAEHILDCLGLSKEDLTPLHFLSSTF